eukprot:8753142-Pyramimonas_sp.AAC.1
MMVALKCAENCDVMLRENMPMNMKDGEALKAAKQALEEEGEGAAGTRQLHGAQEHGCAADLVCGQVERQRAVVQCVQGPRRLGQGQELRLLVWASLPRQDVVEGARR